MVMLLGLIVVQCVMGPPHYLLMIAAAGCSLLLFVGLLLVMLRQAALRSGAVACAVLAIALATAAGKIYFLADGGRWDRDQAFASCCVAVSVLAAVILRIAAAATFIERSKPVTFPVPT